MRNGERRHTFEFINGLRGLAALQVVLLHYCSSFLPRLARAAQFAHYDLETRLDHSPAFFLIDGYSAVYLFFVMSGFVLAPSFLTSNSGIGMQTAKRFTRLYLPVVGALAFALLLILFLPSAKESGPPSIRSPPPRTLTKFRKRLCWSGVKKDASRSSMMTA